MTLNNWFEKAMSAESYIDAMTENKEGLLHIHENFELPNDEAFFAEISAKNLRAIIITEDWCGDAMLNTPILLKIAEKANIKVGMLLRDNNLELMDQYLTNGTARSIPIIIFLDEAGNEFAKWGPRAATVQAFVDETRATIPPKEAADYETKSKEIYKSIGKTFQENREFWNDVYDSIKTALTK